MTGSMPLNRVCSTGMGILLSWFTVVVPTNTSPMAAPWALKPPAVPTLMIKSGLYCWHAKYVLRAAGTVPTLSTLCSASLPVAHNFFFFKFKTQAGWSRFQQVRARLLSAFVIQVTGTVGMGVCDFFSVPPRALCSPAFMPAQLSEDC